MARKNPTDIRNRIEHDYEISEAGFIPKKAVAGLGKKAARAIQKMAKFTLEQSRAYIKEGGPAWPPKGQEERFKATAKTFPKAAKEMPGKDVTRHVQNAADEMTPKEKYKLRRAIQNRKK